VHVRDAVGHSGRSVSLGTRPSTVFARRGRSIRGVTRTKRVRTTKPAIIEQQPAALVEWVFTAVAPNRLWVADLTYVST
jgi:putative transposase